MSQPKRNSLSVALAAALALSAPLAQAQDAPAPTGTAATDLDAVVVTGIRRGIEASIDTKQAEDTIVEAISAEDIGKLPDTSIADSIARLPGLTAQRFGGRPQEINIRGFAGDFATTLLNGREQVSLGNNRGVEFDQYPSELMSQVVVHKTADAALVGQGLSGTVNLKTVRPLSFAERVFAVNVRGDMNKVEDEKEYGKRFSVSYIDQFLDDTVGLSLGYARLDNPGQSHRFNSWGYDGTTNVLNGADIFAIDADNQRDGFSGTLEWKPADGFTSALDLFYSTFDREEHRNGVQFGLVDQTVLATAANGAVTQGTATPSPLVLRNDFNASYDDLFSLGWSNELQIGEAWTLRSDVSTSSGTRNETILETYGVGVAGAPLTYTYNSDGYFDFDFGNDFANLADFALMDPGGWGGDRAQAGYWKEFEIKDRINALRLDAERSFDSGFVRSLEFGANMTTRSKSRASTETMLCITPACVDNVPGVIPPEYASEIALGFAGLDSFLSLDPHALLDNVYVRNQKLHPDIANKNWEINEDVYTYYVQANIDADLGPVPVSGNVGVQAVHAQQDSRGYATSLGNDGGEPLSGDASYTHYLPSMNLSFRFPADQVLRVAAGKQMMRPRMDEMRASSNITYNGTRESPNGVDGTFERSSGNPLLEPTEANAYDLSYEKYFGGNRGYVSVAYFYKDLKTYIYDGDVPFDIRDTPVPIDEFPPGLDPIGWSRQPINGEGGTIEGLELAISIPFDLLWAPLEGFGIQGHYSDTTSEIQPEGPGNPQPLPGLSKYVSNATIYYERYGFSARASRRTRSRFVGEVQGFGGDRTLNQFDGEAVVDAQVGYTFQSGPLQDLSIMLQVNNITDEPFRRINNFSEQPAEFTEYGRTYLLGVNYRF